MDSIFGDFQSVLGWEKLTDMVRKDAPRDFIAADQIFTGREEVRGTDITRWDVLSNDRDEAPYNSRGAAATSMNVAPVGEQSATLSHIFLKVKMDREFLHMLRQPGTDNRIEAVRSKVRKEQERLRDKILYTRERAMWNLLTGTLTVNQLTDEQNTVSWSTSINVGTYDASATSPYIGSWHVAGTRIISHFMKALRDDYNSNTGHQPMRAYCNNSVMRSLITNTEVQTWYKETNNRVLEDHLTAFTIGGIRFNVYDFGSIVSGSLSKMIADDYVIYLPDDNRMMAELHEGTALIPNANNTDLVETTPGIYSYMMNNDGDPPGITLFVGYDFLPVIKWPEVVYYSDVRA